VTACEQLDMATRRFNEFTNAVANLPGYSEAMAGLHWDAQPLRVLEALLLLGRTLKAEREANERDAKLGAEIRRFFHAVKEIWS